METTALIILFHEKLAHYRELITALEAERHCIKSARSEELWRISNQKQHLISDIEAIRERILHALTEMGILHDMTVPTFRVSKVLSLLPIHQRKPLLEIQDALSIAKREIQRRTRENVTYVEAYLATLDDLIRIFTRNGDDSVVYDRHCLTAGANNRALLHREA